MNLEIGLASWVIQDGNYDNFSTGSTVEFALEYTIKDVIKEARADEASLSSLGGGLYEATGFRIPERQADRPFLIVDFGILAYREYGNQNPVEMVPPGAWFSTRAYLSVDYYIYQEGGVGEPALTPMIYTWQIEKILLNTGPFMTCLDANGRDFLMRDPARVAYKEIVKTDAWRDDSGRADYVLCCKKLDVPPRLPRESGR